MLRKCNLKKAKDYNYGYTSGAKVPEDLLEVYTKPEPSLNAFINNILNYQYPKDNLKGFPNGLPKVKAWHLSLGNCGLDPDTQMIAKNQGRQEYWKTVFN